VSRFVSTFLLFDFPDALESRMTLSVA